MRIILWSLFVVCSKSEEITRKVNHVAHSRNHLRSQTSNQEALRPLQVQEKVHTHLEFCSYSGPPEEAINDWE